MVVKPYYEIGSVLLNTWQNDSTSRVNPIMKLKSYGYVIYGNYTCRVADDIESFSALDSLNVRITANCVKKEIFNTCMKLTFEPNNGSLWMKFYDAMDKYLLFMKRNDGVYDYRIQMDESTVTTDDINQLRCPGKVWINPTRTAEFFDIDFTITEAGVTFTNTVGEGE
jgi:phage tail sheath protein FI